MRVDKAFLGGDVGHGARGGVGAHEGRVLVRVALGQVDVIAGAQLVGARLVPRHGRRHHVAAEIQRRLTVGRTEGARRRQPPRVLARV